jgi:hypothetical protein
VLVEWYPSLFNYRERNDMNDAIACVAWAQKEDREGNLYKYFQLSKRAGDKVQFEGWVLGIT